MSIQAFSFPLCETRFFKAGNSVYKFKIRGGNSYSGEEAIPEDCIAQELEDIIRAVLANLDALQPFCTAHFNVFPYKIKWERLSKLTFKHDEEKLSPYPFVITLYLESNVQSGKQAEDNLTPEEVTVPLPLPGLAPQPKRRKTQFSLEALEDAILQNIVDSELAAERAHGTIMNRPQPSTTEEVNTGQNDKKETEQCYEPERDDGTNSHLTAAQGEVHSGTVEEEEVEEERGVAEDVNSAPGSPVKRQGVLTRLASYIFPFSMFVRET